MKYTKTLLCLLCLLAFSNAKSSFSQSIPFSPNFNEKDYDNNKYEISKNLYKHGDILVDVVQVKSNAGFTNSISHCKAWLNIKREEDIIKKMFFDIAPVGFSFGIMVPKKQPSKKYIALLKLGDYDGRLLIIDKQGVEINMRGGFYFIFNDRYLFSQYASDLGALTVFDLQLGSIIYSNDRLPYIHKWYTSKDILFFTESEWLSGGLPTEKPHVIYIFNIKTKSVIRKEIDKPKDAFELSFDFDPREYNDCTFN
jgi:hypothetical protein